MEGENDIAALEERIEYLEGRERDLLIAAEIGQQLLEKNTELDMANRQLVDETRALRAQLDDSKSVRRRKSCSMSPACTTVSLLHVHTLRSLTLRSQSHACSSYLLEMLSQCLSHPLFPSPSLVFLSLSLACPMTHSHSAQHAASRSAQRAASHSLSMSTLHTFSCPKACSQGFSRLC